MRSEPRFHITVVKTEALSEFMPVISPPQQLRNLSRQKKQETERIKKIVEELDHSACAHRGRTVRTLKEQYFGGAVGPCARDIPERHGRHQFRGPFFQNENAGGLEHVGEL